MNRQFCTFFVGANFYGVDVLDVQEVVRPHPMTQVPLSHPAVRGLINLRGQIVTAIDLRRCLDLQDDFANAESVNVVIRTEDGAVSLLVDEIGDVLEVDDAQFELPPATLQGRARELIQGVYKLPDRLLLILDPKRAVTVPTAPG